MNSENNESKALRQITYEYVTRTREVEKELVIRKGDAPKLLDEIRPDAIRLKGTIKAPGEFFTKRKQNHDYNGAHVIYDRNLGTILLVLDERYGKQNYEISGELEDNPDLAPFKINGATFEVKALLEVLKFNRIFFVDREVNNKIVANLMAFKANVQKTIRDISDNRGEDEVSKLTKLEHSLDENFVLEMPIHKGGEKKRFKVDICVTARAAHVEVWLESRELKELQQASADAMINKELEIFKDIVCIEK